MVQAQAQQALTAVGMIGSLELRGPRLTLGPRDLGGRKPRQLLGILLVERGRTVPKDRIAEFLWGEKLPQRADATIETYISVLRGRLDKLSDVGRELIVTEAGGYRLNADRADVDVDRFESLVRRAAASGLAERRVALEAALAVGDGELLDDDPYAEWTLAPREHHRAQVVQAFTDLAECSLDLADYGPALGAAERALELDPAGERAHRGTMLGHYARGDRDAALRAYERCVDALATELGVVPTTETANLHAAILREEELASLLTRRGERSVSIRAGSHAAFPVRYASSDGVRIAYQTIGEGPPDIVFSPSFVTNLGATWDDPTYAAFLRRLAALGRLILFDKRGTGLSDPALDFPTTRERSEDVRAVLDACGSERAVLFGVCAGGALCAQLAADHPERVTGLILHNSSARLVSTEGYPFGWPPEVHQQFLDSFEEAWLSNGEGISRRNPGLVDNPRYRSWFARLTRLAASPWMSRRMAEMNGKLDIRDILGRITVPALVICTTDDVWMSPENSHYLAERIPSARLVELPGVDHDPWVGDSEPVLNAVADFVVELAEPAAAVG